MSETKPDIKEDMAVATVEEKRRVLEVADMIINRLRDLAYIPHLSEMSVAEVVAAMALAYVKYTSVVSPEIEHALNQIRSLWPSFAIVTAGEEAGPEILWPPKVKVEG